jgi:hypothetical protein
MRAQTRRPSHVRSGQCNQLIEQPSTDQRQVHAAPQPVIEVELRCAVEVQKSGVSLSVYIAVRAVQLVPFDVHVRALHHSIRSWTKHNPEKSIASGTCIHINRQVSGRIKQALEDVTFVVQSGVEAVDARCVLAVAAHL